MIDNPIIEILIVLLFGFCLGCLFMIWYLTKVTRNVFVRIASIIGAKFKGTEISLKDLLKGVSTVVDKSLEEVEKAEREESLTRKINGGKNKSH